jgi:hypothetical protein
LPRYQFFFAAISIFFFTSWRYRFFLCLTAKIDFFPPDGNSCLTAILIFSLPHGDNRFFFASRQKLISFRLTVILASWRYQFFFASRQKLISFCLMVIHASQQYHFFFTSRQESISSA